MLRAREAVSGCPGSIARFDVNHQDSHVNGAEETGTEEVLSLRGVCPSFNTADAGAIRLLDEQR